MPMERLLALVAGKSKGSRGKGGGKEREGKPCGKLHRKIQSRPPKPECSGGRCGGGGRWREVKGGGVEGRRGGRMQGGGRWRCGGVEFSFCIYDFKQHFYTTSVAPGRGRPPLIQKLQHKIFRA